MKLPATTSRLLALQDATNVELNARLGEIFRRYRSAAFAGRTDHLFTEHWTPKQAASGYDFERFEMRGADVLLHGVEYSAGFVYRISIGIPQELIDNFAGMDEYFERLTAENKASANLSPPRISDRTQ
jgi:hypothetical protein